MVLPYTDVEIARRVFVNGERARTLHSAERQIPGLFGCANVPDWPTGASGYSCYGIQSLSFVQSGVLNDTVTPYGAFPAALLWAHGIEPEDTAVALQWLWTMLSASHMQSTFGSVEAIAVDGSRVSPLGTWDTKITTMLALVGGTIDITRAYMDRRGVYGRFADVVQREHERVFGDGRLQGESLPFGAPTASVPDALGPTFTACA